MEFSENPQRKWKHETAVLIDALQEAVKHGAVEDEVHAQIAASRTAEGIANIDDAQDLPDATSYLWTTMTQGSEVALREQSARRAQRERARAQDDARIREQADANAPHWDGKRGRHTPSTSMSRRSAAWSIRSIPSSWSTSGARCWPGWTRPTSPGSRVPR